MQQVDLAWYLECGSFENKFGQKISVCTCDGDSDGDSQDGNDEDGRYRNLWGKTALVVGIPLLIIPIAGPMVVRAVGFGAGGIVAGSTAASPMASYGGAVGSASMCAVLQSIGATWAITGGTATASLGGGISAVGVASFEGVRRGATSGAKSLLGATSDSFEGVRQGATSAAESLKGASQGAWRLLGARH